MAKGSTNSGTGGSNKSMIIVTAPTGSTVTATCGTTVKTAVEKNGQWTFKNCDIGTWTVKAVLDGLETSGSVVIKEDGQLMRYSLTLAFWTATIAVTYPAGSVCTCSNGDTVLTAPDTSGSYTFSVHNSGTWTVSAGGKSVQVAVSNEQEYSANLTELVLYDSGDECTSVTGGWEAKGFKYNIQSAQVPTVPTKYNTGGELVTTVTRPSSGGYGSGIVWTRNNVDLTNFKTLRMIGYKECTDSQSHSGLTVIKESSTYWTSDSVAFGEISPNERTIDVDIASISGKYRIAIGMSSANGTCTAHIRKLCLLRT